MTSLESVAAAVLRASWQASVLAAVVLLVQSLLGRRISAGARYALWSLVLIRLALPFNLPSPVSVHNFYPRPTPQPARVEVAQEIPATPVFVVRRATPPPPPVVAPPRMSWPQRLALVWLIGCVLSAASIAVATLRLARHVRRQKPVDDPRVLAILRSCAADLGVRRPPQILTGPRAGGPALVGFLRPRLLLPEPVLAFDDAALRLILLHELAHHKRLDVPANWLLAILQSLHWFNPLVHLAFARVRADRELACDERVLSLTTPADRPAYGRTLVRLIESLSTNAAAAAQVPAPAVGILPGRRQLRRRITMIAEHRPARRTWSLVALALTSLAAAVACTDAVRGQQAPPPPALPAVAATPRVARSPSASETAPNAVPPQADVLSTPEEPAAAADKLLDKRLPELKFDSIPLNDALDFVRQVGNLNLFVDQKALEAAGVQLDAPVTLHLNNITLDQAFRLIGRSAAPVGVELAASADGDVIIFGVVVSGEPPAAAAPAPAPVPAPPPGYAPGGTPLPGVAAAVARAQSGKPAAAEHAVTRVYDVDKLAHGDPAQLQTLTQVVTSSLTLGKSSLMLSVQPFNGKLVMTATPDLHDQVQDLLAMLAQSAPPPPTTKPAPPPSTAQNP